MSLSAETFLNPYIVAYLVIVGASQWLYVLWRQHQRTQLAARRAAQGLPPDILIDHTERLADRRREAAVQSTLLLAAIILTPLILLGVAGVLGNAISDPAVTGLAVAFIALLLWVLLNGTDVAKALLGGLAFKTLAAFKVPFQVGDRVTLKGIGGKVVSFDTFFVTLQTPNDDQVSIPTASLWNEVLTSANAGARASLCVMDFYLAPFVSAEQRQAAEDAVWDAIQSSVYFDSTRPLQIYLRQNPDSIQLTAKAFVASTYNESLFRSDVTRTFLDFSARHDIVLAAPIWKAQLEPPAR